jgi:hypothetical protein
VVLGYPKPDSMNSTLFKREELLSLRKYAKNGGSLLITTGARGDYDLPESLGSLKIFHEMTGIKKYQYSILFNLDKSTYVKSKMNIILRDFPSHPIFGSFTDQDQLIIGKSTYFSLLSDTDAEPILFSPTKTFARSYLSKKKFIAEKKPLLVVNNYYKGKVAAVAFSNFLSQNQEFGINAGSNKKFLIGLLKWLVNFEPEE